MKKMIFFLTVLACAHTGQTQNVGIGIRKPLSKLHVAGDLRIDELGKRRDSGIVLHNLDGVIYSLKLTGSKNDVLHGDGSFAPMNATLAATGDWSTLGNTGIDAATNFLGTIDNTILRFRVNNINAGRLEYNNRNSAFGSHSLHAISTGKSNTAIGASALRKVTTASRLVAVGDSALFNQVTNASGFYGSTAVGSKSLYSNTTGPYNTATGFEASYSNTTGTGNTAVGFQALYKNVGAENNVAVGRSALHHNKATGNTALGSVALYSNTSGSANTASGFSALYTNTTGHSNTAYGFRSLRSNTNGVRNVAVGDSAMITNTTGGHNAAVGTAALRFNTSGEFNTGVGQDVLYSNSTGRENTAAGYNALSFNTTGYDNTAVGASALSSNRFGYGSVAVGKMALGAHFTGVNNVAVGSYSMFQLHQGSNNTALGAFADVSFGDNFTNATAIGYGAKVNANNKVRIGNGAVTKIEGQVPFTTPSDGRFKYNVKEDVRGLDFIMKLRPVTYQFDVKRFDRSLGFTGTENNYALQASYSEAETIRRTGFIAQEVEQAAEQTDYDFSGIGKPERDDEHYSLSYESFVVPLVKAVQELKEIVDKQNRKIEEQQLLIDELRRSKK